MFKPDVDSEENKEARSFNDCRRRRQKRNELVVKKRELAERQAAAAATAAAHESEQEDAAPTPVVPDAAFSNRSADADLNDRIEEIENDMQETFAEFQNIGTKNMDVMDEEWIHNRDNILFLGMSIINIRYIISINFKEFMSY